MRKEGGIGRIQGRKEAKEGGREKAKAKASGGGEAALHTWSPEEEEDREQFIAYCFYCPPSFSPSAARSEFFRQRGKVEPPQPRSQRKMTIRTTRIRTQALVGRARGNEKTNCKKCCLVRFLVQASSSRSFN